MNERKKGEEEMYLFILSLIHLNDKILARFLLKLIAILPLVSGLVQIAEC
jgi:hypothetical protein